MKLPALHEVPNDIIFRITLAYPLREPYTVLKAQVEYGQIKKARRYAFGCRY